MLARSVPLRISMAAALVAALCGTVKAQCSIQVNASPLVIQPGQSAKVDVRASVPPGAFAFAASDFSVAAATPSWSFVTGGVIAGADVLGITASQPHTPQLGIMADPANPYTAWTGRFTPASYAPAYIEIKATPTSFWYYPSELTSSAAPCTPRAGQTGVFVNPVRLREFAAAPGVTNTIHTTADSFVATGRESVLMGLLLPAVNPARESTRSTAATVRTNRLPMTLTFNGQTTASRPMESHSLNFTKIEFKNVPSSSHYEVLVTASEGETVKASLILSNGQQWPFEVRDGRMPFRVDGVPDSVTSHAEADPSGGYVTLGWHFSSGASTSGHPGGLNVIFADGSVRNVRGVSVSGRYVQNNLRQISIAAHSYEATGVGTLTVTPKK